MSVLFLLIGASVSLAVLFLIAFLRSARNGQFDDDYTPSVRILFDQPPANPKEKNPGQNK